MKVYFIAYQVRNSYGWAFGRMEFFANASINTIAQIKDIEDLILESDRKENRFPPMEAVVITNIIFLREEPYV